MKDPDTGKLISVHGTFKYDANKNLVAARYTNLQTGEIFTAQQVIDRGKPNWQYGVATSQIGPDGKRVYSFNALSERDIARGGYASHQVIGPDGDKIYEKADAGQHVTWWHQFKMQFEKGADLSVLGFVAPPGTDLTDLNTLQTNVIYGGGSTKVAVDRAGRVLYLYDKAKVIKSGRDINKTSASQSTSQYPTPGQAPQNIKVEKPPIEAPKIEKPTIEPNPKSIH